jgi:MoxR-like ATPase
VQAEQKVAYFKEKIELIRNELGKVIVGQDKVLKEVLIALIAGGHILLEGVPGLGKTLLVRTLSQVLDISFSRIQFTPDLMPADITGTNLVVEKEQGKRSFEFQKGPIFAHLVLADEINRATPKTQSALLESMQEHSVTVSGIQFKLQQPFMVLATQNPIEMEGTYPLPEAQLDRFLFKTLVPFPSVEEIKVILDRTTGLEIPSAQKVATGSELLEMRDLAKDVLVSSPVMEYISRLVLSTHPDSPYSSSVTKQYIRFGASPRAAQSLVLAAKVNALIEGRYNVGFDDINNIAPSALRHRLILNFEAQAEGLDVEKLLMQLLKEVPNEIGAASKN